MAIDVKLNINLLKKIKQNKLTAYSIRPTWFDWKVYEIFMRVWNPIFMRDPDQYFRLQQDYRRRQLKGLQFPGDTRKLRLRDIPIAKIGQGLLACVVLAIAIYYASKLREIILW